MENEKDKIISEVTGSDYKYGFFSNIETDTIPKGLSEEVVKIISLRKNEPEFMLEWRLKAYEYWKKMKMPTWAHLTVPEIDYQNIIFYAAPKQKPVLNSLDDVDPEIKATFDKLGIPLDEQKKLSGVAMDAVMDSISVKTTFKESLADLGIIFCSMSEAIREHPDLIKKYLGSVVPYTDNFFCDIKFRCFQ